MKITLSLPYGIGYIKLLNYDRLPLQQYQVPSNGYLLFDENNDWLGIEFAKSDKTPVAATVTDFPLNQGVIGENDDWVMILFNEEKEIKNEMECRFILDISQKTNSIYGIEFLDADEEILGPLFNAEPFLKVIWEDENESYMVEVGGEELYVWEPRFYRWSAEDYRKLIEVEVGDYIVSFYENPSEMSDLVKLGYMVRQPKASENNERRVYF